MAKMRNMYEVREFVGSEYSKALGCKLRDRADALRLVRLLKKKGREVFVSPVKVAA